MATDYYALLGVSRGASGDEIKKAFRTKAHQFHPDKSGGDTEKFKQINEAYQVLSDPQKRQQYDQFGQTFDQAQRSGGNPFGDFSQSAWSGTRVDFGDLGDIFGDLFGGRSARAEPERGQDIQAQIRIQFRQAVFGAEQRLEIKHHVRCQHCDGQGAEPGSKLNTCQTCQGTGQVRQTQRTFLGAVQTVGVCSTCGGAGKIPEQPCRTCKGDGRTFDRETITVKIPAGIDNGQSIRLRGKGEAGRQGRPSGDLYLQVMIEPDPQFTRQGEDILIDLNIPLTVAALGGTIPAPTMDGEKTVKIPAGTPSGKVIRLSGHGVPRLRSAGRGDQLMTIAVEIPKKLSAKAKKLLKDLQSEGI